MVGKIRWYRSDDGALAGVCKGLAESIEIDVGFVRLCFLLLLLFGGGGLIFYIALAFSLPRKDKLAQAYEPKVLGVCSRLAKKVGIEVGIIRFLAIASAFASFGVTILVYFALYFFLPEMQGSNIKDVN